MTLEKKPEEEASALEAGAGAYSADAEVEEYAEGEETLPDSNRNGTRQFTSERQQLTEPLNLRAWLETGEAEFELPKADPYNTSDPNTKEKSKESVFEGCDFRNLKVQPETEKEEDGNLALGDFSAIRALMQNVTEDGELMKKVDRAGRQGELPPANAKVLIHYKLMCKNEKGELVTVDDQFDKIDKIDKSKKNKIKEFRLGRGDVIAALDYAVASMELKERATFLSTPEYAFGKFGLPDPLCVRSGPDIADDASMELKERAKFLSTPEYDYGKLGYVVPPNATILFTVELVDFFDQPTSTINKEEGKAKASFDDIEKTANQYTMEGNRQYKHEDYSTAISSYTKGVQILERHVTLNKCEDKRRNDLLFILYSNMAQTCLRNQQFEEAAKLCEKALELPPETEGKKIKVYLRYAQAQTKLGRYEAAKGILRDARKLEPGNWEVRRLDEEISDKMKNYEVAEEQLARKMFADWKLNP